MKTLALTLLALLLIACADEDAERKAEAQAAIDAIRADYDAREARIEAALAEAAALRELPPLAWGERPAPKFLDVRNNKLDKQANGRIFELTPAGKLNTDPATMLGLFTDTSWRDDVAGKVSGEGHLTKGGVEGAFEAYTRVRFLCLLISDEFKEAELGSGTLFTVGFKAGRWKGRAAYFDLDDGKLIGVVALDVTNRANIEFKTEGFEPAEQQKRARAAITEDLRSQILEVAANPNR